MASSDDEIPLLEQHSRSQESQNRSGNESRPIKQKTLSSSCSPQVKLRKMDVIWNKCDGKKPEISVRKEQSELCDASNNVAVCNRSGTIKSLSQESSHKDGSNVKVNQINTHKKQLPIKLKASDIFSFLNDDENQDEIEEASQVHVHEMSLSESEADETSSLGEEERLDSKSSQIVRKSLTRRNELSKVKGVSEEVSKISTKQIKCTLKESNNISSEETNYNPKRPVNQSENCVKATGNVESCANSPYKLHKHPTGDSSAKSSPTKASLEDRNVTLKDGKTTNSVSNLPTNKVIAAELVDKYFDSMQTSVKPRRNLSDKAKRDNWVAMLEEDDDFYMSNRPRNSLKMKLQRDSRTKSKKRKLYDRNVIMPDIGATIVEEEASPHKGLCRSVSSVSKHSRDVATSTSVSKGQQDMERSPSKVHATNTDNLPLLRKTRQYMMENSSHESEQDVKVKSLPQMATHRKGKDFTSSRIRTSGHSTRRSLRQSLRKDYTEDSEVETLNSDSDDNHEQYTTRKNGLNGKKTSKLLGAQQQKGQQDMERSPSKVHATIADNLPMPRRTRQYMMENGSDESEENVKVKALPRRKGKDFASSRIRTSGQSTLTSHRQNLRKDYTEDSEVETISFDSDDNREQYTTRKNGLLRKKASKLPDAQQQISLERGTYEDRGSIEPLSTKPSVQTLKPAFPRRMHNQNTEQDDIDNSERHYSRNRSAKSYTRVMINPFARKTLPQQVRENTDLSDIDISSKSHVRTGKGSPSHRLTNQHVDKYGVDKSDMVLYNVTKSGNQPMRGSPIRKDIYWQIEQDSTTDNSEVESTGAHLGKKHCRIKRKQTNKNVIIEDSDSHDSLLQNVKRGKGSSEVSTSYSTKSDKKRLHEDTALDENLSSSRACGTLRKRVPKYNCEEWQMEAPVKGRTTYPKVQDSNISTISINKTFPPLPSMNMSELSDDEISVGRLLRGRNKSPHLGNCSEESDVPSSHFPKRRLLPEQGTPKRTASGTPLTPKSGARRQLLTPSMPAREVSLRSPQTPLQEAMNRLHVATVPHSLPCREVEFRDVYRFVEGKILDRSSGCMYISGVPGTGKTATIHEVVRSLQSAVKQGDLPAFQFAEVNAMRLTDPREAYVQILQVLGNQRLSSKQAHHILEQKFTRNAKCHKTTLLLVDELDALWTRRQDVVYNLLDWPTNAGSRLVVITIANTMDLPERLMKGRVSSRLGLTRVTFHPYTFNQLEKIVQARLAGIPAFDPDAVQFVARKVASVSGDARRALDICRRATEIAELDDVEHKGRKGVVNMQHVDQALAEMISSPKVQALIACSQMEHLFLRAVSAELERTGVEETCFNKVYRLLTTLCTFEGVKIPTVTLALKVCNSLGSLRLLLTEHSRVDGLQRILLNISSDDLHYALKGVGETPP